MGFPQIYQYRRTCFSDMKTFLTYNAENDARGDLDCHYIVFPVECADAIV